VRHLAFGRKLGRDTNARKALLANLASSLFINGAIVTTLVKAKFARPYVEKLITQAKSNKLTSKRLLASVLARQAFIKLNAEIAPGFAQKTSGYTRIIKLRPRAGDNAPMARIELLPWEKKAIIESPEKKKKVSVTSAVTNQRQSLLKSAQAKSAKSKNEKH